MVSGVQSSCGDSDRSEDQVPEVGNGGEYTLGEFVDYCAEAGIRREFKVPYNPQ